MVALSSRSTCSSAVPLDLDFGRIWPAGLEFDICALHKSKAVYQLFCESRKGLQVSLQGHQLVNGVKGEIRMVTLHVDSPFSHAMHGSMEVLYHSYDILLLLYYYFLFHEQVMKQS